MEKVIVQKKSNLEKHTKLNSQPIKRESGLGLGLIKIPKQLFTFHTITGLRRILWEKASYIKEFLKLIRKFHLEDCCTVLEIIEGRRQ